jgi:hypothetical protein
MTAPDDLGTSTVPPTIVKPASLWEDFIDIFVSPSEVFERRRESGFFVALLVLTVITLVITFVGRPALQPIFDSEFTRSMAAAAQKNPQMTEEQMASIRGFSEKFAPIMIGLATFFIPMIIGVVLWVVGKFVQARENVGAACMIATYAFFPRVLDSLLQVVQGFLMDPSVLNGRYRVTLSPARFLDPDTASPVVVALLGRIDVFTIWITVLLAIGLMVVARIPRSKATLVAVIVWVISALPAIFGAIRAS